MTKIKITDMKRELLYQIHREVYWENTVVADASNEIFGPLSLHMHFIISSQMFLLMSPYK